MIKLFERRTRIAVNRVKKKRSPFIYKAYSPKPKHKWLKKRNAQERRFRRAGLICILLAFLFLLSLTWNIFSNGRSAFTEAQINVPITFYAELVEQDSYRKILQNSLLDLFPNVEERKEKRELFSLVSRNAPHLLEDIAKKHPEVIGKKVKVWMPASSAVSIFYKQHLYEQTKRTGKISSSFPLGVATAIYLEEFARKSWFTDFIEININNLAAVPSIIFGLLGLSIYLNFFGLPRSSSLVGGMVLALLILPVIVIATRNALQSVPSSIRYAAAALGATPTQVVFHHTLIYALPGIMTGVILSVARAFGETAPLLMIGMVAFIADAPKTFTDPATTLPVQVYLWANNPELGFVEKTAAAIMVLLTFMVFINLLAIYIRRRFEIKW